jgi:hypothetical protein
VFGLGFDMGGSSSCWWQGDRLIGALRHRFGSYKRKKKRFDVEDRDVILNIGVMLLNASKKQ